MVAADLPVDTAGAAGRRVDTCQPYEFTKWSNKEFETKGDEQTTHEAYRAMLQSTSSIEVDDILWVQQAATSCLQEPKQMHPSKCNTQGSRTTRNITHPMTGTSTVILARSEV